MDEESIRSQLDESREPGWVDTRLQAMSRLPKAGKGELRSLITLKRREYGGEFLDRSPEQAARVGALFASLDDRQTEHVWRGLFPNLMPHVQRAWSDAPLRSLQVWYGQFPFRAPEREAFARMQRSQFFLSLCGLLHGLDPSPEWLAVHAGYIQARYGDNQTLAWLLGTVLRSGGPDADRVRSVIIDSINGDHEVARMGRHSIATLLFSDERSDWEFVGKLLLAAKRQEGLRKSILETVAQAHPGAFRYVLGLILEHDLGRFSSVVRAFDTWLGYQWAGGAAKTVHDGIATLCRFFDDDSARLAAIESGEAEETYLALWVSAFIDATDALRHVRGVVSSPDPARRYAALTVLRHSQLMPEIIDIPAGMLLEGGDSDERILTTICEMLSELRYRDANYTVSDELFDAVARIFHLFPVKKKRLDPLVWPWDRFVRERRRVAGTLASLAKDQPQRMLPFADALEAHQCANVIKQVAGLPLPWEERAAAANPKPRRDMSPEERSFVVRMMADTRGPVHEVAFKALQGSEVTEDEVDLLKDNLRRTSAGFRRAAIERLRCLPPARLLAVGEDLIRMRQVGKQSAGLDLLHALIDDRKHGPAAKAIVERHRQQLASSPEIEAAVSLVLEADEPQPVLDDALGLVSPGSRCAPIGLRTGSVPIETEAAVLCLQSLARVFLEHAETEIVRTEGGYTPGSAGERVLMSSYFPYPGLNREDWVDREAVLATMPLREVWERWASDRDERHRDPDGLELTRAWAIADDRKGRYREGLPKEFAQRGNWQLGNSFSALVQWMPLLQPQDGALGVLVQHVEDLIGAYEPAPEADRPRPHHDYDRLPEALAISRVRRFDRYLPLIDSRDPKEVSTRLAALKMVAMERGIPGCEEGPNLEEFCAAYDAGLFNEHDFVMLLLKERQLDKESRRNIDRRFGPISRVTGSRPHELLVDRPELNAKAQQVRERLFELEIARGEQPIAASAPSTLLGFVGGAEVLFRIVTALGKAKIIRGHEFGEPARAYSLSGLIAATKPCDEDTDERFAGLVKEHGIKTARLLEIGMYAPQWAGHIERATDQPGFEEAVWWVRAHTGGLRWCCWCEQCNAKRARVSEHMEVDADELCKGAVDVGWFRRLIERIGGEAWAVFEKPAKYTSSLGEHKRVLMLAGVMLGRVSREELIERIDSKRDKDAVRALGLLPLPDSEADARREALVLYTRLQEFLRESRKGGSQRQENEGQVVEIALRNLARNAGYGDPQRLRWAMEREAVADLAEGPVTVEVAETAVSLSIDADGAPQLTIARKGRALRDVPAKLRTNADISGLAARVADLRRQNSRMRLSLEESMCRGDVFSGSELQDFMAHPMLRPMVERLVFVGANDSSSSLCGYPARDGRVLRGCSAAEEPIGSKDALRIAHPLDLFRRGGWHEWQRECFERERVQPFKQVFRELYPKTAAESEGTDLSKRYAGHQVNPRQALALFKKRQWVFAPGEGCRRVFHDAGLVAELWFEEHFHTPADVEGLTLAGVAFRKAGSSFGHVTLSSVPDRLFSETMRDLDLVASVAHAGGVDPEASASTVEMRAALLRETCRLLELENVKVKGHHAIIQGTKGRYSVHLGSGSTMVLPGKMLVIVAVHSQYRGRLFLPFADDDPRSAEVMAKALLLARDQEIRDPSILEQIHD